MSHMDIFTNNAFSMVSLTAAVEKIAFIPNTLGELGIFEEKGVYTRQLSVEKRGNKLALIPTSPLGAPARQKDAKKATIRNFQTQRLAEGFTMYAHEVEGIRAFGKETLLKAITTEYADRMGDVRDDMDLTHEWHRFGTLQGKLLDADGTTVLYDYFDEFGITEPAAFDFKLNIATTKVRDVCNNITRVMKRRAGGSYNSRTKIHTLCGDEFYDSLIGHQSVEKTYEGWAAAAALRTGTAWQDFEFGDIVFHNYRGTDDNSTVAIAANECKLFPVGAKGVFKKAMAPSEFGPFVNTRGKDVYAMNIRDKDRDAWVKGEQYSYPLYMCLQPEALGSGVSGN